ncbi:hypothetical protein PUN28_000981 [Cardiocondyla obscurior]|uniref:Uncharacterized protein n=1 Tax=Cardiocondyla obscurior TaxID=286306 RepID=A0AAW2H2A3_9HYME
MAYVVRFAGNSTVFSLPVLCRGADLSRRELNGGQTIETNATPGFLFPSSSPPPEFSGASILSEKKRRAEVCIAKDINKRQCCRARAAAAVRRAPATAEVGAREFFVEVRTRRATKVDRRPF